MFQKIILEYTIDLCTKTQLISNWSFKYSSKCALICVRDVTSAQWKRVYMLCKYFNVTYLKSHKAQSDDQNLLHLDDLAVSVKKRCPPELHGAFIYRLNVYTITKGLLSKLQSTHSTLIKFCWKEIKIGNICVTVYHLFYRDGAIEILYFIDLSAKLHRCHHSNGHCYLQIFQTHFTKGQILTSNTKKKRISE